MTLKIHVLDTDPRKLTDPLYHTNCGSFSIVANGFNSGLKSIGCYAEPDDADFVGICDALNVGFKYKNKRVFIVNVWDTINSLPNELVNSARFYNPIVFGLSNQITNLWAKYGIKCSTTMPGCDVDFWTPGENAKDKFKGPHTYFLFNSFANVRSGLDLALDAFTEAFTKNDPVTLIIKNTDSNPTLENWILEKSSKANIIYMKGRSSFEQMRELYRMANYSLNVMRMSSWGLGIHEALACGCIPVIGNFCPSNEIIEGIYAYKLNPTSAISIYDKIQELTSKGLHNAYGNLIYNEEPLFYDYSIKEYSLLLKYLVKVKNTEVVLDIDNQRSILKEKWSWEKAAQNLINKLNE